MEIWKEIKGYEGIYEVSNLGQVRSSFGKTTEKTRFNKKVLSTWKQRILKTRTNKENSVFINLFKNKTRRNFIVARLVAYTFYNQDYNDHSKTVNHIDGNRLNNKLENLEIINFKDNIRHALVNDLFLTKKVFLRKTNQNFLLEFNSCASASRYINKASNYISRQIRIKKYKIQDYEIMEENNENMETKRVSYFFRD
jgi:uncharacterized protein (DUF2164 family)